MNPFSAIMFAFAWMGSLLAIACAINDDEPTWFLFTTILASASLSVGLATV